MSITLPQTHSYSGPFDSKATGAIFCSALSVHRLTNGSESLEMAGKLGTAEVAARPKRPSASERWARCRAWVFK